MLIPKFYYSATFRKIIEDNRDEILNESRAVALDLRADWLSISVDQSKEYAGEELWPIVRDYLDRIEAALETIICRRSIVSWLHIIRRIAPVCFDDDESVTDPVTTHIVRHHTELAIKKYGGSDDGSLGPVGNIKVQNFLHNQFYLAEAAELGGKLKAKKRFKEIKLAGEEVILDFEVRDIFDIFKIERLSLEYWKSCALMRAAGKGARCRYSQSKKWFEHYSGEIKPWLFGVYDERTRIADGWAFNNTLWIDLSDKIEIGTNLISTPYNANIINRKIYYFNKDSSEFEPIYSKPNFNIVILNITGLEEEVNIYGELFDLKHGIKIERVIRILGALQTLVLIYNRKRDLSESIEERTSAIFANLSFRGYALAPANLTDFMNEFISLDAFGDITQEEVEQTVRIMELNSDEIALWARARNHAFISYGVSKRLYDFAWLSYSLMDLFFRIVAPDGAHGDEFEKVVEKRLKAAKISYQKNVKLVFYDGSNREADFLVQLGGTMYIIECSAIGRAIDYEISRPDGVSRRKCKHLKKIEQARSLCELLQKNSIGRNFDYSGCKKIDWRVVSPFVEFLWEGNDYWDDRHQPRLVAVNEICEFLENDKLLAPIFDQIEEFEERHALHGGIWY